MTPISHHASSPSAQPPSGLLAWASSAALRFMPNRRSEPHSAFICAGVQRAGAFHLATLLGGASEIGVSRLARWKPHGALEPAETPLYDGGDDLKAALRESGDGHRIVGAPFVLGADEPLLRQELPQMRSAIASDIKIIHITRPYTESLLSRAARGLIWRLGDAIRPAGLDAQYPNNPLIQSIRRLETMGSERGDVCAHQPSELARRLLVSLMNDLAIYELGQSRPEGGYLQVRYEDIAARLPEILTFLGAKETDADALLAAPLLRKLEPLDPGLLPHHALLEQLGGELDGILAAVFDGRFKADQVWTDDMPPLALTQKAQMLVSMLAALDMAPATDMADQLRRA